MILLLLVLAASLIVVFIHLKGKINEGYWTKKGIPFHPENKAVGPVWEYAKSKKPLFSIYNDIYKKYPNEPVVGIGGIKGPALLIRDPENIQHVLQNDFSAFYHRGITVHKNDVLGDNIVFMNGIRWKLTRQMMTPLFTSAKLKNMFYIIERSAKDFVDHLRTHPELHKGNAYDTLTTFSGTSMSAAVFNFDSNTVDIATLLSMVRQIVKPSLAVTLKFSIIAWDISFLKPIFFSVYENFFVGAIRKLLQHRAKDNNVFKKHDFADLCLKVKQNGAIKDPETDYELQPSDQLFAAQGFLFYIAGVEPSTSALFTVLVELGKHPEILQKAHKEVDDMYEKYNGKITFDVISELVYLDRILMEALRLYPPLAYVSRKCMTASVLPKGNISIEPGTTVVVCMYSVHHDPKYFPNPEVFDPDRETRNDIWFMGFGKGARKCIGARYAKLQILTCLVYFLRHFSVETYEMHDLRKFAKLPFQLRLNNIDCRFIPRN